MKDTYWVVACPKRQEIMAIFATAHEAECWRKLQGSRASTWFVEECRLSSRHRAINKHTSYKE